MPASTRSKNKQSRLEDVGAGELKDGKPTATTYTAKKRKSVEQPKDSQQNTKKPRQLSSKDSGDDGDSIIINRAPVLELWGSCVTQFLYPSLPWPTCLSAGSAIATITAISKGRSIGKIEKPDSDEADRKRQERKKRAKDESLEELETMSFKLHLDEEKQAMVGGKPKKASEDTLVKKYGGVEQYERVKRTFERALESWKEKETELDHQAFGMYEHFRPTVPPGQSGWGRKGQLNLKTVEKSISGS